MFTVLIIGERLWPRFERVRALFEPFIADRSLAVCEWQQTSADDDLNVLIPDLHEALIGKREWQGIVVDSGSNSRTGVHATTPENPFDYLDNIGVDPVTGRPREQLNLAESPHPRVRLAHLLLGYPDIGAKAFTPDPSYRDADSGRRVYESDVRANAEAGGLDVESEVERFLLELGGKWDTQVHYREVYYGLDEQAEHRRLTERYRPRYIRPAELLFITSREPIAESPGLDLRRAWGQFADAGPTRFVERNDYPASCRFAVYDLAQHETEESELVQLKFWSSILSMAANNLPASTLQAERVYRVGVEFDLDLLAQILNEHLSRMMAIADDIDAEIHRARKGMPTQISELLAPLPIQVAFDQVDGREMQTPSAGYGWATDVPSSESIRWNNAAADLRASADALIRRPRRVLSRTVMQTRQLTRGFLETGETLDDITRAELVEELTRRSRRLSQPITVNILDRERLYRIIDNADERLRRMIDRRMSRSTIFAATAVILGAWIAGFVPYLLQAGFVSGVTFAESLLTFSLTIGVLLATSVLTLAWMRRRLVALIETLNRELRDFTTSVSDGAAAFGEYLRDLIVYMRGQATLLATDRKAAGHEANRLRWAAIRARIQRAIDMEKAIVREAGKDFSIERGAKYEVDLSIVSASQLDEFMYLPRGRRTALLNESGETIQAPYDFVVRLRLQNLLLSEPTSVSAGNENS